MGKRSNFQRNPRDFYPTPYKAVEPLLDFLDGKFNFIEPCAGDGRLANYLLEAGHKCDLMCDIDPQANGIWKADASLEVMEYEGLYITNPPWDRKMLHPLIDTLRKGAITWLLLDADWMHTIQSSPYMKYCSHIIPIGRVKWIEGSKHTGKDNCCWYCFTPWPSDTIFHPR